MGTTSSKETRKTKTASTMSMNEGSSLYDRRAYHAGSWYSDDKNTLDITLTEYLDAAAKDIDVSSTQQQQQQQHHHHQTSSSSLRGIICPHAGYSYSGPTAAYSYYCMKQELLRHACPIEHILVLHPSHHVYLNGCAVSNANVLETPIGNIPVDAALRNEILELNDTCRHKFTIMEQSVDEAEHSGEMQYPYIAKIINDIAIEKNSKPKKYIPVLPIMCGNLSIKQEEEYGKLLASIIARPNVFCIISTDFCHWGYRFSFQPTPTLSLLGNDNKNMKIYEYIQQLDKEGMDLIELQNPNAFATYFQKTRNTICGRHAIQTWLNAVHYNDTQKVETIDVQFIKYAQSSSAETMKDSSVSYASATARTTSTTSKK